MRTEVVVKFWPGDKAIIVDPCIKCVIDEVRITPLGVTYSVHYWIDRELAGVEVYGYELTEEKNEKN